MIESDMHLVQAPLYRVKNKGWHCDYTEALQFCGNELNWDPAAIMGIISFCYTSGNRTLLTEIERKPWLSELNGDSDPILKKIPKHGLLWCEASEMAVEMEKLLLEEARKVCKGRKTIYILLSGGLDSRIVAGILFKLYKEGYLANKPIGVTWGVANCRDVAYARDVAKILGFEWKQIGNSADNLLHNIEIAPEVMGAIVPPDHLHNLDWFRQVSPDALVLAGSYGDSVGRAEFCGKHLVELRDLTPCNVYGLLKKEVATEAIARVRKDFDEFSSRCPKGTAKYVLREHVRQGVYMRNMLGQVTSIINRYCDYYQMFTVPEVYGYMWSKHPVCRNNDMYAELLERLNPQLARLPWARTNKALRGKTIGQRKNLTQDHHKYCEWIAIDVYKRYAEYVSPGWFEATGLFDASAIRELSNVVEKGKVSSRQPYEIWSWLITFRKFAEMVEKTGRKVKDYEDISTGSASDNFPVKTTNRSFLKRTLSKSKLIRRIFTPVRKFVLKKRFKKKYPPVFK